MHNWKVVPLSKGQLLDVRKEDILEDGLYRKCETYRGGGGYDQFPVICEKRLGRRAHQQFIVQLFGCNLDCPYCYVTREGVWGDPVKKTTEELVRAFMRSTQEVFHLMGGAPALQLSYWPELIDELFTRTPWPLFHSDLLLTEREYKVSEIKQISRYGCLYAIDVKGTNAKEWFKNTRKPFDEAMFWSNLYNIAYRGDPDCFYFTFTGCNESGVKQFIEQVEQKFGSALTRDWFSIDLIEYDALPYVDSRPWGAKIIEIRR